MGNTIKWGILGCGRIAESFIKDMFVVPDCEISALGSRSSGRAYALKRKYNMDDVKIYDSYEKLVSDPETDVIYIATPHHLHYNHTVLALENGKSVLCEKPFAINGNQAEKMINLSRKRKLFLMEAMWTRFLPVLIRVKEYIQEGIIGNVLRITADFSNVGEDLSPEGRLLNPDLGGGSLLDIGVYPVFFAGFLLDEIPDEIVSVMDFGKTGVDEQVFMILQYPCRCYAFLSASLKMTGFNCARIDGEKGAIVIPEFWKAKSAWILRPGEQDIEIRNQYGYQFQIREVNSCLFNKQTESRLMSHLSTLSLMRVLDSIRKKAGLKYPMEQE